MLGIVGGSFVPKLSRRRALVEWAWYVGTHGNDSRGPVHMAVTEGRAEWYPSVGSTSCGDVVNGGLFAVGCREPFINREEHEGWRQGHNLSLFVTETDARIEKPRLSDLRGGDVCIYDYANGRAHGFIFIGRDELGRAMTVDGGQPGITIHHAPVNDLGWGPLLVRGRPLDFAISLDRLPFAAPAQTVRQWCATHGLDDPGPVMPAEYLADQWEGL